MRVFASEFQILIRSKLPIYTLMTGLYENIYKLQNEPSLTFLYRAPKIKLTPLNIASISGHYRNTFNLDDDNVRRMSALTKGYPFAFQVLGYYTFEAGGDYNGALINYRQHLDEYVYDKIWSELSLKDREALNALINSTDGSVAEIREALNMKPNEFAPYRERLIRKGVVDGSTRGYLSLTLPMFDEYIRDHFVEA